MGEEKVRESRHKSLAWTVLSWVGFTLLSSLIIVESATPGDASSRQSNWVSQVFAWFINATGEGEVNIAQPKAISLAPGTVFTKQDEAVVGTTKAISYSLSYDEGASTFDSGIEVVRKDGSTTEDYDINISSNNKGGVIRVMPYEVGEYDFTVKTATDSVSVTYQFSAIGKQEPTDFEIHDESFTLGIGQSTKLNAELISERSLSSSETNDHYMSRFFDVSKIQAESSDTDIFTYKDGVLKGVSAGKATLNVGERQIPVTVTSSQIDVNNLTLSATDGIDEVTVHSFDHDYFNAEEMLGEQLNVTFSDGKEHSLTWTSSDENIACVTNEHYDSGLGKNVPGGFVSGNKKKGEATITATLDEDPSKSVSFKVSVEDVQPSSATFNLMLGSQEYSAGSELHAGDTLTLSADFSPSNAADKTIHVTSSDESVAKVLNNDTSSVSVNLLSKGSFTLTAYANGNSDLTFESGSISVQAAEIINSNNFDDFAGFVRKSAGHFLLFFFTAIFGFFAFYLTLSKLKLRLYIASGCSFVVGVFLGAVSECIQTIPSLHRNGAFSDVLIDSLGYLTATAILLLIFFLVERHRRKKVSHEENVDDK